MINWDDLLKYENTPKPMPPGTYYANVTNSVVNDSGAIIDYEIFGGPCDGRAVKSSIKSSPVDDRIASILEEED